jgi:hypothetical protein
MQFKASCPVHRHKDLEYLIKKEKGNKDKIAEQIQTWWDEPVPVVEEKWEDVSKKSSKKKSDHAQSTSSSNNGPREGKKDRGEGGGGRGGRGGSFQGGRSSDRGGGRGYGRGGSAGGRGGGGPDARRVRGRGDRDATDKSGPSTSSSSGGASSGPAAAAAAAAVSAGPKPVSASRPLQGAWGARATVSAAAPSAGSQEVEQQQHVAPSAVVPDVEPVIVKPAVDVGIVVSDQDPTPSGRTDSFIPPKPRPPASTTGNVWATKGSAHLIQAEKKSVSATTAPSSSTSSSAVAVPSEPHVNRSGVMGDEGLLSSSSTSTKPIAQPPQEENPIMVAPVVEPPTSKVTESLPIQSSGWVSSTASAPISEPSPVGPVSIDSPLIEEPVRPRTAEAVAAPVAPIPETTRAPPSHPTSASASLKPTTVLNMGHWETGEGEESVSHDFGFGFDNDHASVDETTISSTTNNINTAASASVQDTVSVANTTVSPARPPPGLGIGMPPMPEKIVHVHELENKLENASLKTKEEEPKKAPESSMPNSLPAVPQQNMPPIMAGPPDGFAQMPQMPQQSYAAGQYGMGMYSYTPQTGAVGAHNAFMGVGIPGGAPIGVPPQQKQQNLGQQQGGAISQQQGNIYGVSGPSGQTNESNISSASNEAANNPANAGMPPGMASMAHYNPAFIYGQQAYQMGQPHGVGYGFGFAGQYGGVQAGYGYQQVMGQGAGYGQPYDDQGQLHGGNSHQGGYSNKNSTGGYRGRNTHHNQYQSQYNPQGHGGYGGQPYNMGYTDHFSQRGGYGQQPMDPYMQSSPYQQNMDHGKGNKNKPNGRSNFGNNQYQQGGNQFGGIQGGSGANDSANPTFQGWGGGGL